MSTAVESLASDPDVRRSGVGSSDAAPSVGLSRNKTRGALWAEKLGLESGTPDNAFMKRGRRYEPLVAETFEEETGLKLHRVNQTLRNPEYPFMMAHLDRRIVGQPTIVEIKTVGLFASRDEWGESGSSDVPTDVYLQVQHQLCCAPRMESAFVAALFSLDDFRIYPIAADPETMAVLVAEESGFWDLVLSKTSPAPRSYVDVQRMFPKHIEKAIEADEAALGAYLTYRENKAHEKEVKALLKPLQMQIGAFLEEHDTLTVDGEPVLTWRTQSSRRFSESAFKADHPDLYAKFLRDLPSRVMRLKGEL